MLKVFATHLLARPGDHMFGNVDAGHPAAAGIMGERQAGAGADFQNIGAGRGGKRGKLAVAVAQDAAIDAIIDRCPALIDFLLIFRPLAKLRHV